MKRYLTNKYFFSAKKIKHLDVRVQFDGWASFGEQSLILKVCCAPLSSISRAPQFDNHCSKLLVLWYIITNTNSPATNRLSYGAA
jgi:hypothetical protein